MSVSAVTAIEVSVVDTFTDESAADVAVSVVGLVSPSPAAAGTSTCTHRSALPPEGTAAVDVTGVLQSAPNTWAGQVLDDATVYESGSEPLLVRWTVYAAVAPDFAAPFCDAGVAVTACAGAAGSEIAKTCMSPPVAVGSVMLATVLATDTGALIANRWVVTLSRPLPPALRYAVATASTLPGTGVPPPPPSVQSLNRASNVEVVPSV